MGNLHTYWLGLSPKDRKDFAAKSGLSHDYINTHLIHRRKIPSLSAIDCLATASNGDLSYHGLCDFFISKTKGLDIA